MAIIIVGSLVAISKLNLVDDYGVSSFCGSRTAKLNVVPLVGMCQHLEKLCEAAKLLLMSCRNIFRAHRVRTGCSEDLDFNLSVTIGYAIQM